MSSHPERADAAEELLRYVLPRFQALRPRDRQAFLRRLQSNGEAPARIGVWTPPPPPPPARRKTPHAPERFQK